MKIDNLTLFQIGKCKIAWSSSSLVILWYFTSRDVAIPVVYDLKSVGPLEFKLVAPMPEQLKTTAMHFYIVYRKAY